MVVVAVAGGTGDMGRLIVEALLKRGLYEVYVFSRRIPESTTPVISPLSGKEYTPSVQTDYASEAELTQLLEKHSVHTVICTFAIDFEAASEAQLRLIRAADSTSCVQRFLPSEFNVDYDLGDDVLPYPEKRLHAVARRQLETTRLEFAYIYPGMFMDYYGMPHIETHLRALPSMLDGATDTAHILGAGDTHCVLSHTRDVARYTALALELGSWPRVLKIVPSSVTMNQLAGLMEKSLGRKLRVERTSIEESRKNPAAGLDPNDPMVQAFPGGAEQLGSLMVDLGACMELGAYDFANVEGMDLVRAFRGRTEPPMRIEELIDLAWKGR